MDIQTINSTSVLSRCIRFIGVPIFAALAVTLMIPIVAFSQATDVPLGTAGNFRILAGSGVTIVTGTTVTGNVGCATVTNNGTVNGDVWVTTYSGAGTVNGTTYPVGTTVSTAQIDLTTAYDDSIARTGATAKAVELGGTTLTAGVYSGGTFGITGDLTLNGGPTDFFIFQITSTLITAAGSRVIGTALASNIFWQVGSSATLAGDIKGNILALTSITLNPGATLDGRVLARNGAVSLEGNNTALPVELTSFTAALKKSVVELNWNTATEVNNYGFEIERLAISDQLLANSQKLNTNSWSKIGFVQGHGNSNSQKEYSFEDMNPTTGKLQYRLKQIDFDGAFEYSGVVEVEVEAPKQFVVYQNYPNPFNPETVISYQLPIGGLVTLKVYDLLGGEIATLVNEYKAAGTYNSQFSIRNLQLPSGVYFYTLKAGNYLQAKKMLLMK